MLLTKFNSTINQWHIKRRQLGHFCCLLKIVFRVNSIKTFEKFKDFEY